jgi:hypothetical protein
MTYVLVREIEAMRREASDFDDEKMARAAFEEARYVADNGPDDAPGDDPTIVSNCWLYWSGSVDPLAAREDALSGRARLIDAYMD